MKCAWHSCPNEAKHKFCSSQCKNKYYVDRRRKKLKQMAIDYKGGSCKNCGYSKSIWALEFHHLDPDQKDFALGSGNTRAWESIKIELDKCIMLCANCHREIHHGVLQI